MIALVLAASLSGTPVPSPSVGEGFVPLFDGKSLAGWRGYLRGSAPKGWSAKDGELVITPGVEGGDLITTESFADFDLRLEWKVSKGANSGIFFRASEDTPYIWQKSHEYQLLDDASNPNTGPMYTAGACYDLYPVKAKVARPAGEWNESRIVAIGPKVEHWLNGTKVCEYVVGSEDWLKQLERSKFKSYDGFGRLPSGKIGLQDHGHLVSFRNIRIKKL